MKQDIMTDFGYCYIVTCNYVSVVFSWLKRLHYSAVMWFSELKRQFSFFYLLLCTLLMIIYHKNAIGLIFCEITSVHPYNTISVSRYLVKNIVIFTHFIILAAPTTHKKSSVTTYISSNHRNHPIWNFTIVIGFSSVLPRPKSKEVKQFCVFFKAYLVY